MALKERDFRMLAAGFAQEVRERSRAKDGYSTSSEYVCELIRADQVRRAEHELGC